MAGKSIIEGLANRMKSTFNAQNGRGMLTSQKFICSKDSLGKTVAIGLIVNLTYKAFPKAGSGTPREGVIYGK